MSTNGYRFDAIHWLSLVLMIAAIGVQLIAASDMQTNSSSDSSLPIDTTNEVTDSEMRATFEVMANGTSHEFNESNQTSIGDQLSAQLSGDTAGDDSDTSEESDAQSISQLNATTSPSVSETRVNCTPINITAYAIDNQTTSQVILVNSSKLNQYLDSKPNVTQTVGAECALVIFYYKWCPFSAKYAKHFNALARVYPQFLVLAIDAYGLNSINMRYGLVGIPSVLFFHNGKVVGKVNDTEPTVEGFVSYIHHLTGMSPIGDTNITEADMEGPLSSQPEPRFDFLLLFSWIFVFICFGYLFAKSNIFKTTIETVRNNWREAEAQHEHID